MTDELNKGISFEDDEVADAGEYECILKLDVKTNADGSPRLLCTFRVRDDVEQPFKGVAAFMSLFLDKDFNTQELTDHGKAGWFDFKKSRALTLATPNVKNGGKRDFATVDEWIQYMNGQTIKCKFTKEFDEFHNGDVNKVENYSWVPTSHQLVKENPVLTSSIENTSNDITKDGDDLPF